MAEVSPTHVAILRWLVGGGRSATKQDVFEYYQARGPLVAGALKLSRRGAAARVFFAMEDAGLIADGEVTKRGRQVASGG